ncbi:MAG: hypothetical protein JST54_15375 [Deltaproteobacteria bacterium]|nr:hypothetical protein [Deltaproteobacteria bacterium]
MRRAAVLLFVLAACDHKLPPQFPVCADAPVVTDAGTAVTATYYGDIKPILDGRCIGCHTAGGLAPFSLDSFDLASANAALMAADVQTRHMPPWLADHCCQEYRDSPQLTPEQIALFGAWLDAGTPLGDPADAGAPIPTLGMSRVDVEVGMGAPYTPHQQNELRCFTLDWPEQTTKFVTGINLKVGNRSIVHHVILYVVDQGSADSLKKQENADGQPGFDCTGGLVGANVTGGLAGWQPGSQGLDFPDHTGTKVEPHSAIVMQIHYSLEHGGSGSDQTTLQLEASDSATELKGIAVGDLLWMANGSMRIPKGAVDYPYTTEIHPIDLYSSGNPMLLYNVSLHMHQFATHGLLTLEHADGTRECLLQVSNWDMGWNGTFWFAQPLRVVSGDKIFLECDFTNTTDHDLVWSNSGEMCAGFGTYIDAH